MMWMIAIILQGQLFVSNERFMDLDACEKAKPKFKPYICMQLTELKPDQLLQEKNDDGLRPDAP